MVDSNQTLEYIIIINNVLI